VFWSIEMLLNTGKLGSASMTTVAAGVRVLNLSNVRLYTWPVSSIQYGLAEAALFAHSLPRADVLVGAIPSARANTGAVRVDCELSHVRPEYPIKLP
jgi:hypothetical protein